MKIEVQESENTLTIIPNKMFLDNIAAEDRKRWSDALLSGKYNQGLGTLKIIDGDGICHCCLGVFINAVTNESIMMTCENDGEFEKRKSFEGTIDSRAFPKAANKLGNDPNPEIGEMLDSGGEHDSFITASECNDDWKLTFEQIAYLIYPER